MFEDIITEEKSCPKKPRPKELPAEQGMAGNVMKSVKCDFHGVALDLVTCNSFHYSAAQGCKYYQVNTRDCALKQSGITP